MSNKKGRWFKIERQPGWCHCEAEEKPNYVIPSDNFVYCPEVFELMTGFKLKPGEKAEFRLEMRRKKK